MSDNEIPQPLEQRQHQKQTQEQEHAPALACNNGSLFQANGMSSLNQQFPQYAMEGGRFNDDIAPPPPTPGLRKLCGHPQERINTNYFPEDIPNFSPHLYPQYNNPACPGAGSIMPSNGIPRRVEGFNQSFNFEFIFRILIVIFIIWLVFYYMGKL